MDLTDENEIKRMALGQRVDTLVIRGGVTNLREKMDRLLRGGYAESTPVAVHWEDLASYETLVGTVGTIADWAQYCHFRPPGVIVIGQVDQLIVDRG